MLLMCRKQVRWMNEREIKGRVPLILVSDNRSDSNRCDLYYTECCSETRKESKVSPTNYPRHVSGRNRRRNLTLRGWKNIPSASWISLGKKSTSTAKQTKKNIVYLKHIHSRVKPSVRWEVTFACKVHIQYLWMLPPFFIVSHYYSPLVITCARERENLPINRKCNSDRDRDERLLPSLTFKASSIQAGAALCAVVLFGLFPGSFYGNWSRGFLVRRSAGGCGNRFIIHHHDLKRPEVLSFARKMRNRIAFLKRPNEGRRWVVEFFIVVAITNTRRNPDIVQTHTHTHLTWVKISMQNTMRREASEGRKGGKKATSSLSLSLFHSFISAPFFASSSSSCPFCSSLSLSFSSTLCVWSVCVCECVPPLLPHSQHSHTHSNYKLLGLSKGAPSINPTNHPRSTRRVSLSCMRNSHRDSGELEEVVVVVVVVAAAAAVRRRRDDDVQRDLRVLRQAHPRQVRHDGVGQAVARRVRQMLRLQEATRPKVLRAGSQDLLQGGLLPVSYSLTHSLRLRGFLGVKKVNFASAGERRENGVQFPLFCVLAVVVKYQASSAELATKGYFTPAAAAIDDWWAGRNNGAGEFFIRKQ